ncbi:hypothetical protein NB16F79_21850 [Escherichia coli]
MAKPIITLNGLKIVIMLGMLVIILCGIRFAAEIIVPFILALFIAVILNPLVQHMVRWRVPRVLAVSILMTIIVMAMVLLSGFRAQRVDADVTAISQLYYDAAASS